MKKLRDDYWKAIVGGLILTTIFVYVLASLLIMLFQRRNLEEIIKDPRGVYDWFFVAEKEPLLIILVLTPLFLIFITKKLGLYKKGYEDASEHGVHGTSRWGTIEELKESGAISKNAPFNKRNPMKALANESGIILGKATGKKELIILPKSSSVDNRNICVVGSSGSGKGQAFVYNNIINNREETIIVTDPKGEIHHATNQIKRDQGYDVFQIDFINLAEARYNPLDYVRKDIDAKKIADSISRNSSKDGKEDFFFSTARDMLTGLIIYCKSKNPQASIPVDVKREFFKVSDDENYLWEVCDEIGEEHPAYQYLKDASVAEGKTRSAILSSFAQQTAIFSLKDVQEMTKASDFNFHEFQKRKSILYVKIPMKNNPVEALTATFFDQLIDVLYGIADQNESLLPINTIQLLDEFANIGKINDFEGTLSTCRGLGMSISTIIQGFDQLENNYGKETARTIINNHDTLLFLKTKDIETAKYLSQLAGETTAKFKTEGSSQTGGFFSKNYSTSKSDNEQLVKRDLIPVGDFTNIKNHKAYLFVSGHYPLEIEKAFQYNVYGTFLFNKKRKPNYLKWQDKYIKKFNLEPTPVHIAKKDDDVNFDESSTVITEEAQANGSTDNLENEVITESLNEKTANINSASNEIETQEETEIKTTIIPEPNRIDDLLNDFFDKAQHTKQVIQKQEQVKQEHLKHGEKKIEEFLYQAITLGNLFKLDDERKQQSVNERIIEEVKNETDYELPDDLQFEEQEEIDAEQEFSEILPKSDEVHSFIKNMKSQMKTKNEQTELTGKTLQEHLHESFENATELEGVSR
jgi:type IV secretion system protein VirD4